MSFLSVFKKYSIWSYLKNPMFLFIIQFFAYYLMAKFEFVILETGVGFFTDMTVMSVVAILIITLVMRSRYKFSDYRFKSGFYILAMALTSAISGILLDNENVINIESGEISIPVILIIFVPLLLIAVRTTSNINELISPFKKEVELLASQVQSGDYGAQITSVEVSTDSVFGPVVQFMNSMVGSVNVLFSQMSQSSNLLKNTAASLSSSAEEVNASAEEVASTSQGMSEGANTQTVLITQVNYDLVSLQKVVDDIVINIQSNTQLVAQIALQTNILALNAGIEASRAGDYGRGFAVVAENVRKLSDESKLASERIEDVADQIQTTLQASFNKINSFMVNVVAVSEETAASAEEVAASAEEMTASMEEISSLALDLIAKADESKEAFVVTKNE